MDRPEPSECRLELKGSQKSSGRSFSFFFLVFLPVFWEWGRRLTKFFFFFFLSVFGSGALIRMFFFFHFWGSRSFFFWFFSRFFGSGGAA